MNEQRDRMAAWMGREIVPHEPAVRRWLARHWRQAVDAEDVIQEAYCRIASLSSVEHIDNPGGYFHRTVRAVAVDLSRRASAIAFTGLSQSEWSTVLDNDPSADRVIEAGQELTRVNGLLATLSETSRRVIEVKNDLVRALQKVMKTIAAQDADGRQWRRSAGNRAKGGRNCQASTILRRSAIRLPNGRSRPRIGN